MSRLLEYGGGGRWTLRRSFAPGKIEGTIDVTAEALWADVAARLQGSLNDKTYRTWFGETSAVAVDDASFVLAVPNDFTREWIEGHFLAFVRSAACDVLGHEVRVGYFDQKLADLDEEHSLIEEVRSIRGDFNEDRARAFLGRFRFSGDDPFRKVKGLSGGERNRLALAKMMQIGRAHV